jgi:hypothetical protein
MSLLAPDTDPFRRHPATPAVGTWKKLKENSQPRLTAVCMITSLTRVSVAIYENLVGRILLSPNRLALNKSCDTASGQTEEAADESD